MHKPSLLRSIKYETIKISRQRGNLNEIALGAAIGSFISVFPTFGLGTPLVFLLYRFVRFNLVSAIALSLISNPFTSPFFLFISYKVGVFVTHTTVAFNAENWTKNLKELGWGMLIGSIIISSLVSIIAFLATKYLVKFYREQKERYAKQP